MSPSRTQVGIAAGLAVVVTAGVVAVSLAWGGPEEGQAGSPQESPEQSVVGGNALEPSATDADAAALVAAVAHGSKGDLGPMRLADGLVPPTNRWFSGLVFGDEPMPVFPLPLTFGLSEDGFAFGLPAVVTSEKGIIGPFTPAVAVDAGAASSRVVAYDNASVTIELLDDAGAATGRVVIAEGSPFVSYTADVDQSLTTGVEFGTVTDGAATATVGEHEYGVVTAGTLEGSTLDLAAGESATWYALPDDAKAAGTEALARAAADPLVGTDLGADLTSDAATTTITYRTAGGADSLVVTMPHHRSADGSSSEECTLGTYQSVYGAMELCDTTQLRTAVDVVAPSGTLDLTGLDDETKAELVAQLRLDVEATGALPSDTYFGGKALYRSATLVALGEQLDVPEVVAPLRETTATLLREWTELDGCTDRTTRCFQYDEVARGLVGLDPSFGSEEFNDHHFHYGYFLSAAGILAADDPELAADLAPVLNLAALDIAASGAGDAFPDLRVFDAYRGHSWASGVSPFADGNNQESTSEATSAWNGLALWAEATDQPELVARATWLLSAEAASTRAYWTEPPLDEPVYDGFQHQVFALSWGGKRDYATWFSPEPSAMLGIQLIPMAPVADYLEGNPERIKANVAEATTGGFGVQFGDYMLMYLALADPEAAREEAAKLPDTSIDDGNSRTYMLAWLASRTLASEGTDG